MNNKKVLVSVIMLTMIFATASSTAMAAQGDPGGLGQNMVDENENSLPDGQEDFDGDGILNMDDEDYDKTYQNLKDDDGDGIPNKDDADYSAPVDGSGNVVGYGNGLQDGLETGVSDGSGYANDNGKKENMVGDGSRDGMELREGEAQFKNSEMYNRVKGKILIKPEDDGRAYYVSPDNGMMRYLGRPADAFAVMREEGLGISNENFDDWDGVAPENLAGKILLKVEDLGQAYYVNPDTLEMVFLNRPADAFDAMRNLGLGISNEDFDSSFVE